MTGIPARIGRYEIIGRLGGGGMGVVYKAHDPQIGRDVAIKQIREELDSQELRDRLLREVRATGRLRHPNIVSTFDIGDHDGFPFIVMELVEGRPLDAIITASDKLPLRTRIDLMAQLCSGLAAAHDAGIIHRDVKPANLIVDAAGTLKIVDFGIARLTASATGTVAIGTANYMSPEQWTGHRVDIRTDIFAAGALFYEMLSGVKAFPGKSLPEICQRVMNEQPAPLETLCDGLPQQIVQIVNRMLDKTPSNRFESLTPVRTQLLDIHARLTKSDETAYATTIRMRRSELQATAAATSEEPGIDLAAVERRRTTQIETHLRVARAAFDRGDLPQAAASCEDVLVLDSNQAAALELLKQIRRLQTHGTAGRPSASNAAAQPAVQPIVQPVVQPAVPPAFQESVRPAFHPPSPPAAYVPPAPAPERTWRPELVVGLPAIAAAVALVGYLLWPRDSVPPAAQINPAPQSAVANTPAAQQSAPPPPAASPTTSVPAEPNVPAQPSQTGSRAAGARSNDASRNATPQRASVPPRATSPPLPPPPAAVRVGGRIAQPRKTKDVKPTYPAAAQAARVQGVVILEATIGTTGKVQDAKILRSIPMLDEPALDAVKQWEFTPTLLNGVPVPVIMTVTVNFELKSRGPNVEGLDPDGVTRLLGPPSSTQSDYAGFRIWYYDRPEGTLAIYFKDGRASLRRPQ
jgi:TonB family protein